jgi:hypothetical protein
MDHLGVEVATSDEVAVAVNRLADAGLATRVEGDTTCCYAVQDKVWVTGPGGEPWEVYTVKGDARPDLEGVTALDLSEVAGDGTCCSTVTLSTDSMSTDIPADVAAAGTGTRGTAAACC